MKKLVFKYIDILIKSFTTAPESKFVVVGLAVSVNNILATDSGLSVDNF